MTAPVVQAGRTYVRPRSDARAQLGAVAFCLFLSILFFGLSLTDGQPGAHPEVLAYLCLPPLALAALLYFSHRRFLVVLHPDHLRIRGIFDRTIRLDEIAGGRVHEDTLHLFDHENRHLASLDLDFERDAAFDHWFDELADLDQRDFHQAREEARQTDPRRLTREAFVAEFQKERRLDLWVGALLSAVALWLAFYPRPYLPLLAFGLLAPPALLALAFALPHRIRFRTIEGWAGVDVLVLLITVALGARATADARALDWQRVALLTAQLALLLSAVVYQIAGRDKWKTTIALSWLTIIYAVAAVVLGNQVLDRSLPTVVELRVMSKIGAPGDASCSIVAAEADEGDIGRRYGAQCSAVAKIEVGQRVRVEFLAGAFDILWWRWHHAPAPASPAASSADSARRNTPTASETKLPHRLLKNDQAFEATSLGM